MIEKDHLGDWSTEKSLTLKMASAQVVETSVTNNSLLQDSSHPDDLFQSRSEIILNNINSMSAR